MGEELKEWAHMWGAKVSNTTIVMIILIYIHLTFKVKLRNDMPDDILKDAIETSRRVLESITDFESQGNIITIITSTIIITTATTTATTTNTTSNNTTTTTTIYYHLQQLLLLPL